MTRIKRSCELNTASVDFRHRRSIRRDWLGALAASFAIKYTDLRMLNTERRKSSSDVDAHIEMAASNKCITTSLHDENDVPYRLIADRTTWLTSRQIKSRKLWRWPIVKHLCARNRARTRLIVQNSATGSYNKHLWTNNLDICICVKYAEY